MSKDKDELIPELVRNTLNELNHQVTKKNQYIKLLEDRIEELETENFYLRKNQKTEPDSEGVQYPFKPQTVASVTPEPATGSSIVA